MKEGKIIKEIEKLPLEKRMAIAERILQSIRRKKENEKIEKAAEKLQEDYQNDEELTAFTSLDLEEFYETR